MNVIFTLATAFICLPLGELLRRPEKDMQETFDTRSIAASMRILEIFH